LARAAAGPAGRRRGSTLAFPERWRTRAQYPYSGRPGRTPIAAGEEPARASCINDGSAIWRARIASPALCCAWRAARGSPVAKPTAGGTPATGAFRCGDGREQAPRPLVSRLLNRCVRARSVDLTTPRGEVAEWLKAPHSKCGILARVSGVRIPPSPPETRPAISLRRRSRSPAVDHADLARKGCGTQPRS